MINPRKRQRENRKLTLSQKLQVVRLVEELRADSYPYKECQIAQKVAEKRLRNITNCGFLVLHSTYELVNHKWSIYQKGNKSLKIFRKYENNVSQFIH